MRGGEGQILAVAADQTHRFAKVPRVEIELAAGLGVVGDAHHGEKVQHRSRVAKQPDAPNLRQVHLIHAELFDELGEAGFNVSPGELGENVTTRGVNLLALPRGTRLLLGSTAVIELTGLRNPCRQIDENIGQGAMAAVLARGGDGSLIRKAGVMAVVVRSGTVRRGDSAVVEWLPVDRQPLEPV